MSNEQITKRTVKVKENDLVDLIDNIVTETVAVKKIEWLAEQEAKGKSLLENRIQTLEATIKRLTESKK